MDHFEDAAIINALKTERFEILGHGAGILGHSMTEMKATGA